MNSRMKGSFEMLRPATAPRRKNFYAALPALIAAALLCAAPVMAQEVKLKDKRKDRIIRSVYETGRHSAPTWGARAALALCAPHIKDMPDDAGLHATLDEFKNSIRVAYGEFYPVYRTAIEGWLARPEHEERYTIGLNRVAEQLRSSQCDDFIIARTLSDSDRALRGSKKAMERLVDSLR